ncbi:hypothetical protein EW125_13650, partial [Vibrio cholerae]|nr:hypothetical protein [Vibrio cholerae]
MDNQTLTNSLESLQVYFDKLRAMHTYEDSRATRYLESSRALIKNLMLFIDCSNRSVGERMIANIDLLISGEKTGLFFESGLYSQLSSFKFICLNDNTLSHGGARKGAGRKKQEPTIQIRVPQSLVDLLIELKSHYACLDDESKYLTRENLMALVKKL